VTLAANDARQLSASEPYVKRTTMFQKWSRASPKGIEQLAKLVIFGTRYYTLGNLGASAPRAPTQMPNGPISDRERIVYLEISRSGLSSWGSLANIPTIPTSSIRAMATKFRSHDAWKSH